LSQDRQAILEGRAAHNSEEGFMTLTTMLKGATVAALVSLVLPAAAGAQSVADFYKGKDVIILVGSGAGGGYDTYTRTLARYLGKHIPGNPNIVVQNMPGANGVKMMNQLYNQSPKDGTVLGSPYAANLIEPILDQGKATQYDSRKFSWIGNITPQYNACFVRKDAPVQTLEGAMKQEVHISATGANSNGAVLANVYNTLIGTKFKVVNGYTTAESVLAVERKEVDGSCLSYDSLLASNPRMIEENLITWLIVLNPVGVDQLPGTPPATKFAKTKEERDILEFLSSRNIMGRPYVAPPGVPADRLAALRDAFMATMKDADYLAETKKLKMAIAPQDHTAMEKMIDSAYKIPQETVKKAAELTKEE
jgi:tripartite-type tricarboxylate transporter receptor subunit TctC